MADLKEEKLRIMNVLLEHKDKNFVKRILDPNIYPVVNNPDGTVSTHKMAYSTGDGAAYVYPTIIQGKDGKLMELPPEDAWNYAMITGEYIKTKTEKEAAWLSENYKKIWNKY